MQWKATQTNAYQQAVELDRKPNSPRRAVANLLCPCLGLEFPKGMEFEVDSTDQPYLSWIEGTVADGVPTPQLNWVVISFAKSGPPILITLAPGHTAQFIITGSPGQWKITSPDLSGWVRLCLPLGVKDSPTPNVGSMAKMVQAIAPKVNRFEGPAPEVIGIRLKPEAGGLLADWVFSAPAVVPFPLAQSSAQVGCQLKSQVSPLDCTTAEGPLFQTKWNDLVVYFPMRSATKGRWLTKPVTEPPLGSSTPGSTIALCNEILQCNRPAQAVKEAVGSYRTFIGSAVMTKEPNTGQIVPYAADGSDLDRVAQEALLKSTLAFTGDDIEDNPMFASIVWRRDWLTWLPWAPEAAALKSSESAAALCVIAGSLETSPVERLDAVMFQVGLLAETRLPLTADTKPTPAAPTDYPPFSVLRKLICRTITDPTEDWFGGARKIESNQTVWMSSNGNSKRIHWMCTTLAATYIDLRLPVGSVVEGGDGIAGLAGVSLGKNRIRLKVTASKVGECIFNLIEPKK